MNAVAPTGKSKREIWPGRSVFWQTAAVLALVLLIAQAAGFALLVSERQRWALFETTGPAITRFVDVAQKMATAPAAERNELARKSGGNVARFHYADASVVEMRRMLDDGQVRGRLERALQARGIEVRAVRASSRGLKSSPPGQGPRFPFRGPADAQPPAPNAPNGERPNWNGPPPKGPMGVGGGEFGPPPGSPRDLRAVMLSAQFSDGRWLNMDAMTEKPDLGFWWRVIGAEVLIFALVTFASLLIASRVAGAFGALGAAAAEIGRGARAAIPVEGPEELRVVARAFNDMSERIHALLEEKDRMLGAVGHDLRTPLAGMRIRAETMEPESERHELVRMIDETSRMLEDILDLARLGRSTEPKRLVDVTALLDSVVEEFVAMGADVSLAESPKAPVSCQSLLVRRLFRNLIDNAVKYGECARCSVTIGAYGLKITVEDEGPGVLAAHIPALTEPFRRLETSRNRETGGAGLGLALAAAIAESQDASLLFENRPTRGLRASVIWSGTRLGLAGAAGQSE